MDIGIDFSLIAYILFAAFVGLGFPYLLLTTGRQYAAGFVVIASLGAFIYFGMQWFNGLRLKKEHILDWEKEERHNAINSFA